jgi:hypothetical protein
MARSAVNYSYEADLAFQAPGTAAVTATAVVDPTAVAVTDNNQFKTATGLDLASLDKLANVRSGDQKNKLGGEKYDIVVVVSALDLADADETYGFNVYVGAAADGNAGALVGSIAGVTQAGQYVIPVDANTAELLDADREEIALEVAVGGTTPSITFSAWLAYGSKAA